MSILEQIIEYKKKEVRDRKMLFPSHTLERGIFFERPTHSLRKVLLDTNQSGIIAEIKRQSPSKGVINPNVSVERISTGYVQAGASALSILTDTKFFGGTNEDLRIARRYTSVPILRKDFVIDEYQIVEAKSVGADVILLIAAVLTAAEVNKFTMFAHSLGLEVLLEVHNEQEFLANRDTGIDLIGVNNRDLKTFEVSVEISKQLSDLMPKEVVKVSESGIDNPASILELRRYGFKGFLIGQAFMQESYPEKACEEFIQALDSADLRTP